MNRKMYWGVAILIVLLGTAAVFVIMHEVAENRDLKDQLAEAERLANQIEQQQVSENNPPPAEPGFKWVWHHNHWDKVPINANGPIAHHDPITEVSDERPQQKEVVRPNLSVEGEVEFSQLPELPMDIDPDDIPPFYRISHDGDRYHYNRPLTARERTVYNTLRADGTYGSNPARLKVSAIILVRMEKREAGELQFIWNGLLDGSMTSAESDHHLALFYEVSRARKGGF